MTSDIGAARSRSGGERRELGALASSVADEDHGYRDEASSHVDADAEQVPMHTHVLRYRVDGPNDERRTERHLPRTRARIHEPQSISVPASRAGQSVSALVSSATVAYPGSAIPAVVSMRLRCAVFPWQATVAGRDAVRAETHRHVLVHDVCPHPFVVHLPGWPLLWRGSV